MLETAEQNATSALVISDMAPAATPRLMDRVRDRIRSSLVRGERYV